MEDYDQPESKYGRIYKVAGPCKYCISLTRRQWSLLRKCQDQRCTNLLRLAGIDQLERSLSSKVILLLFSATKILVSNTICLIKQLIAGLTIGDPVYRTGNPLSVELGPGIFLCYLIIIVQVSSRLFLTVFKDPLRLLQETQTVSSYPEVQMYHLLIKLKNGSSPLTINSRLETFLLEVMLSVQFLRTISSTSIEL